MEKFCQSCGIAIENEDDMALTSIRVKIMTTVNIVLGLEVLLRMLRWTK